MISRCREGILQIATGKKYRDEAISSAQRIRPLINGRPILVTDKPALVPSGIFDSLILHPQPQNSFRDKILPLLKLPYRRTLFWILTLSVSPIEDLFQILRYSMSLDVMHPLDGVTGKMTRCLRIFELNSGVLGMRRGSSRALVRYRLRFYDFAGIKFDQATLELHYGGLQTIGVFALGFFHQSIIYEHQNHGLPAQGYQ